MLRRSKRLREASSRPSSPNNAPAEADNNEVLAQPVQDGLHATDTPPIVVPPQMAERSGLIIYGPKPHRITFRDGKPAGTFQDWMEQRTAFAISKGICDYDPRVDDKFSTFWNFYGSGEGSNRWGISRHAASDTNCLSFFDYYDRWFYTKDQFRKVQGVIRGFATWFAQAVSWDDLDAEMQAKITMLSPRAKDFVNHSKGAAIMASALIWRLLDDSILSKRDTRLKWTSPEWQAQAVLFDLMKVTVDPESLDDLVGFLKFNAYMVAKINLASGSFNRFEVDSLMKIIAEYIHAIIPEPSADKMKKRYHQQLRCITEEVGRLDYLMNQSMSDFAFVFCQPESKAVHSFAFRQSHLGMHMEDCCEFEKARGTQIEGEPVDLVVSPVFVRYGTQGACYETPVSWCPMSVCVKYFEELEDESDEDEVTQMSPIEEVEGQGSKPDA
ncbi:Fc.00g036380.m01.CDS01 [Cosmosporella sp. VM-42]